MKIIVKRDKRSIIIALFTDLFLLISAIEILLLRVNCETIALAVAFSFAAFYMTELGFLHYSLDDAGLHQHLFLMTRSASWSDFTNVSIEKSENSPKDVFVVCFNRGVLDLGSQHVNLGLHPLRYHIIYLQTNSMEKRDTFRKHGITGYVSEDVFLKLMKRCGITVCDTR